MNTYDFVKESNSIESIYREPTHAEIDEHNRFINLCGVTVGDIRHFVSVYQPNAKIRDTQGMNVHVGNYFPPEGGYYVVATLKEILAFMDETSPYQTHVRYEKLHPFTDGNGRSGRVLWAWHMKQLSKPITLGFLHHFYYQSLDGGRL